MTGITRSLTASLLAQVTAALPPTASKQHSIGMVRKWSDTTWQDQLALHLHTGGLAYCFLLNDADFALSTANFASAASAAVARAKTTPSIQRTAGIAQYL